MTSTSEFNGIGLFVCRTKILFQAGVCLDTEFRMTNTFNQECFMCCDAYLLNEGEFIVLSLKDITRSKQHENFLFVLEADSEIH